MLPSLSNGIGSGLDVSSIVSQLMAIERRPLLQLDQKEAQVQAEISAYGTLKGALSSLQSSLGQLKEQSTFQARTASSSDEEVFTVSADTDAVVAPPVPASARVAARKLTPKLTGVTCTRTSAALASLDVAKDDGSAVSLAGRAVRNVRV